MQLAIAVGQADIVRIHQGQASHATARERLHGPRTDAAQTDHRNMAARETFDRAAAVQSVDAGEALFEDRIHAPF